MIDWAAPGMEPDLRALWALCFGDGERYIDLFFSRRYRPEQALVACENGRPAAMLHALPLTVRAGGEELDARYIYAVATHPDHRGRGLGAALLAELHRRLEGEGVALSMLVPATPALFGYYAARGYETQFAADLLEVEPRREGPEIALRPAALRALAPLRDAVFGGSALYARWDAEALAYQDEEGALTGCETLAFEHPHPGYAYCCPAPGRVFIKELAAAPDDALFSAIARRYGAKTLTVRCRVGEGGRGFAMARWYRPRPSLGKGEAPYLGLVLD